MSAARDKNYNVFAACGGKNAAHHWCKRNLCILDCIYFIYTVNYEMVMHY